MRFDVSVLGTSVLLSTAVSAASVVVPRNPTAEEAGAVALAALLERASPEAPHGYTPSQVQCPSSRPSIRAANGLSPNETSWLELRRNNTVSAMRDLLGRMNITGLDTDSYIDNNANNATALPNIAIALSGGGYRALMNGAGAVAAFDNRTINNTEAGHLGGLLQSATYLAALSGGGWMVGSLFANNFTSVQSIVDTEPKYSGSLWQFGNSILEGPDTGGVQLLDTAEYYDDLYDDVEGKADAGFETSITDYWGRALSYQLVNASEGGPAYTFSSIQDDTMFLNGNTPMPILVSDGRAPDEVVISSNATVYEFNPWEMGSFDPTVYGFAPLRYVGSNFTNGSLPSNDSCIAGFDNIGYVMGTSSSLFNQFLLNLNSTSAPQILKNIVGDILEDLGENNDDIADWTPNPFYGYHPETNPNADTDRLTLVDGGEDLENLPLHPLIQPARGVDVIFAVDSSADTTYNWPNGTAMVATYERSLNETIQNGTAFPSIPDVNTFVNLGLNNHPTFFGCNASNMTGISPLIVYIPNSPYIYDSNVSTYTLSYNNTARNLIIQNGADVASMGNGTVDEQWPTCVGCAMLSRSLDRTGTTVPDVCTSCFDRYCWNGTTNSTVPNDYEPEYKLQEVDATSGAERFVPSFLAATIAAAATGFALL